MTLQCEVDEPKLDELIQPAASRSPAASPVSAAMTWSIDVTGTNLNVPPTTASTGIEAALRRYAEEDAAHIRVETVGGEVVLSGVVHATAERTRAANAGVS